MQRSYSEMASGSSIERGDLFIRAERDDKGQPAIIAGALT
jgi:hypothetical protein